MRRPEAFFCPSEIDPRSMFATPENPWPPPLPPLPAAQIYAGYGCRPEIEIPDNPAPGLLIPHLIRFKSKSVLADLTATPARVDTRHRTGINVLRGDGSAKWINRATFDEDLKPCASIDPIYNSNQDRIWATLDLQ
jgi:hypothetical protein